MIKKRKLKRSRKTKCSNQALRSLIQHCWIHSGYLDCGYIHMTTKEKALYNRVLGRDPR